MIVFDAIPSVTVQSGVVEDAVPINNTKMYNFNNKDGSVTTKTVRTIRSRCNIGVTNIEDIQYFSFLLNWNMFYWNI
jgi:hypothetical protein